MPFGWGGPSTVNIANVLINADVTIPTAYKLSCDEMKETTAGHGTLIDNPAGAAAAWAMLGGS
jgi:hypothetical protein